MTEISSTLSSTSASSAGSLTGGQTVDQDQFLSMLVAQLKNQDPLEPMKNEDFLAQLATFSQLEEQQATHQTLKSLVTLETAALSLTSLAQGGAIVGKEIEYVPDGGAGEQTRKGLVTAVLFEPQGVMVEVNGEKVPLGNLLGVLAPSAVEPTSTAGGTTATTPAASGVDDETLPAANEAAPGE